MRSFYQLYCELQNAATQNLSINVGKQIQDQVLQILQQPAYAQYKQQWDRMVANPKLWTEFQQEFAKKSNNTYKLAPAALIQLITQHLTKAAGTKSTIPAGNYGNPQAPAPASVPYMQS